MKSEKNPNKNQAGSRLAKRIKYAAIPALIGIATLFSTNSPYGSKRKEKEDEEWINVPGVGEVPKSLCDMGIASVKPQIASAVMGMYLLSRNYDQGRRISKVPFRIATKAQSCNLHVMNGHYAGYYNPENIWRSVDESRVVFAEKIQEDLSKVDYATYHSLNSQLQGVVDRARTIVDKTLTGRV